MCFSHEGVEAELALAAFTAQLTVKLSLNARNHWCDHADYRSHGRRSAARGAVLNIRECKQAAIVGCSYKYQAIMEAVLMNGMTCRYSC